MDLDEIWYAISLHVYEWIATKILDPSSNFPPLGGGEGKRPIIHFLNQLTDFN